MPRRSSVFLTWQSCDFLHPARNRKNKKRNLKFQKTDQQIFKMKSNCHDFSASREAQDKPLWSIGRSWWGLTGQNTERPNELAIFRISIFRPNNDVELRFFGVQPARRAPVLDAGGKPSTLFPPGGLVDVPILQEHRSSRNVWALLQVLALKNHRSRKSLQANLLKSCKS